MRKLSELYWILYLRIKDRSYKSEGICNNILALCLIDKSITVPECNALLEHFKENKPKEDLHVLFFTSEAFIKQDENFWWTRDERGRVERKLFVSYLYRYTKHTGK